VNITPAGAADFRKGQATYTLHIAGGAAKKYTVKIVENNNPLFNGLYADPEVLYSHKTKSIISIQQAMALQLVRHLLQNFFFTDLVNWKDEGVILDLNKDVSWAKRNAWAPTIIEKKIDGQYKYFYYFCAAQKIGVAVADDPAGPFSDAGKPLIFKHPNGAKGGQEIDPMYLKILLPAKIICIGAMVIWQ
jgi:beta-xylosidase